jgi:hypothetical protein
MKLAALGLLLWLFIHRPATAQKKAPPRFEDFPAAEQFNGKPARVKLTSRRARLYRTTIRTQAEEPPDFAGHYKVATWGCGAGCAGLAAVDLKTGKVYFVPQVEAVMVLLEQDEVPIQRRADSRLLILQGAVMDAAERTRRGKFYYEWRNNRFRLLRADKVEREEEPK